jgi:hypothetical protein
MEKRWFKVSAFRAHIGTGKELTVPIFIFERDVISVLDKYKTIPGIKKKISTTKFPDIYELDETDALVLEEFIKHEGHVSLERAKEKWFSLQ